MRGVSRVVVIILMASHTGIGNIGIIPVVAGIAIQAHMCASQDIVIIMDWESGRSPSCISGMAGGTIRRQTQGYMAWISSGIIIIDMASGTSAGSGSVIAIMTSNAIVCNGGMGTGKRVVIAVNRESSWFPSRVGSMACGTIIRN